MGVTEQRALTPLFWGHVNPYGTFRLDMTARLPLDLPTPDAAPDQFLLQPHSTATLHLVTRMFGLAHLARRRMFATPPKHAPQEVSKVGQPPD